MGEKEWVKEWVFYKDNNINLVLTMCHIRCEAAHTYYLTITIPMRHVLLSNPIYTDEDMEG